MSRIANDWVWKQNIKPATHKLILLAMADRADEYHCCYPSIARLERDTGLDRKTIQKGISNMIACGLLSDTGKRVGTTNKVRVLRMNIGEEQSQKRDDLQADNHPKNGNVPKNGNNPKNGTLNDPNFGTLNDPKNGMQNHPIEPPNEPLPPSGVSAPARDPAPREPSSEIPKPPPAKPERFDPMLALGEHGVGEQLAADWLTVRRQKRAPLTQTALDGLVREAVTAGIPVVEAVRICVERGWVGFKASWGWRDDAPQHPQGRTFDQQGREVVQPAGVPSGFGAATMPPQRTSKVAMGIAVLEEMKEKIRRGEI